MNKRKTYLDWLRVVAIVLVIYNHLPAHALSRETGLFGFVFPAVLVKIGVPLFLMISGSLLLGRDEQTKVLLGTRVLRMVVIIPVAYIGLYLVRSLHETVLHGAAFEFSLKDCIYGLFSRNLVTKDSGPYWYLYAYLGYLLMLPFLRGAAKLMRRSHFILLIAIHAGIYTVLPLINAVLNCCGLDSIRITESFSVPLAVEQIFFYPLAGYWLDRSSTVDSMCHKKRFAILFAALAGAVTSALLYGKLGEKAALELTEWSSAITLFLFVKWMFFGKQAEVTKLSVRICGLSGLVFGIYLLDPYLKLVLFGAYYTVGSRLPEPVCSLLWIPISISVGGFITWILKKIPGVKRFL